MASARRLQRAGRGQNLRRQEQADLRSAHRARASASALDTVVRLVPPKARILVEALWPGPLTLVMPKREAIPTS